MTGLAHFLDEFEIDEGAAPVSATARTLVGSSASAVLDAIGGRTFNLGVFRTFTAETAPAWDRTLGDLFPAFNGIIACVGYGWDGRIIAQVLADREDIDRGVAIFNPSTADCLNAPIDLVAFLNEDLAEDNDVLEAWRYFDWLSADNPPAHYNECVGFDVPLFADGADDIDNMSTIDLQVYWDISKDLIAQYLEANDGDRLSI